jgi:hypothetical protein
MIGMAKTSAVALATEEVQSLFGVAPAIVADLASAAQRGLLSFDDPHRLSGQFVERLRVQPQLSWIGYGDAVSGRYVGATRWEDGEIVEYVADPAVNGSMPEQHAVAEDGTESPPKFVETEPYFVVNRPWFKEGLGNPGIYWTPFQKDGYRRIRHYMHDAVHGTRFRNRDRGIPRRIAPGTRRGVSV